MPCNERAVLLVTRQIEGTATHVARERIELRCGLSAGHAGSHRDAGHEQEWEAVRGRPTTLLRHEEEAQPAPNLGKR